MSLHASCPCESRPNLRCAFPCRQPLGTFVVKAKETDPDKKIYGAKMCEKVLGLHAKQQTALAEAEQRLLPPVEARATHRLPSHTRTEEAHEAALPALEARERDAAEQARLAAERAAEEAGAAAAEREAAAEAERVIAERRAEERRAQEADLAAARARMEAQEAEREERLALQR